MVLGYSSWCMSCGAFRAWLWDIVPGAQSEVGTGTSEGGQVGWDDKGPFESQERMCLGLKAAQPSDAEGRWHFRRLLWWMAGWQEATRGSGHRACCGCPASGNPRRLSLLPWRPGAPRHSRGQIPSPLGPFFSCLTQLRGQRFQRAS